LEKVLNPLNTYFIRPGSIWGDVIGTSQLQKAYYADFESCVKN